MTTTATVPVVSTRVLSDDARNRFQQILETRQKFSEQFLKLVKGYLQENLENWDALIRHDTKRVDEFLKPAWEEFWGYASTKISREEFNIERKAILRSLQFDVGLYYVRHKMISLKTLKEVARQIGRQEDRRKAREAALQRLIRQGYGRRQERKLARQEEMRKEAAAARREVEQVREVVHDIVKRNALPLATSTSRDTIYDAMMDRLNSFPNTPTGTQMAWESIVKSVGDFYADASVRRRFGAARYNAQIGKVS